MFGKRRDKIHELRAVLIEKRILKVHDDAKEARNLIKMKYALYKQGDETFQGKAAYELKFMTDKGVLVFYVSNVQYNSIKLNALGTLTKNRDLLISFETEKIATEEDAKNLGW